METLLDIKDLRTCFYTGYGTVYAVDSFNLSMLKGDTLGLVGESGSGKTTVGLSIMRMLPLNGKILSGEIFFEKKNLLQLTESEMCKIRGRKISMVFQNPMSSLNPVYTVGEQIAEVYKFHEGLSKKELWQKVLEIAQAVGVPDAEKILSYYPHQLSGGMRQRIMLAIALACKPFLLIADEPTSMLDVTVQAQILELLKRLQKEFSLSILLITHDLGVVAELANRVVVMYCGTIVESGPISEVFKKPLHPYTIGLLECLPKTGKEKVLATIEGTVPTLTRLPSNCRFHPRCPYLKTICKKEKPPNVKVSREHFVSCFLYSDTP